jgi:DNA modification methylase
MKKYLFEESLEWRSWVTPKPLEEKPVHRWYVFPHSFTSDLVHTLIDKWGLGRSDKILDPFLGAGTTILAAKERGVPAIGYDLSPFATFVAGVKIANYDTDRLLATWKRFKGRVSRLKMREAKKDYSELVREALPGKLLGGFEAIDSCIGKLPILGIEKAFFRLALLSTIPAFSRAVASGGWLKWTDNRATVRSLPSAFRESVESMLNDLVKDCEHGKNHWRAGQADARRLPEPKETFSALITSPPYPNRHDYTRVFGIELMFGFLDWEGTRALRYQSFHSHPEARPRRACTKEYQRPTSLKRALKQIEGEHNDHRIAKMIDGYFTDMYLCLAEAHRVCRPDAKVAFVLGNAQYCGCPVLVDQITAEIGEQVGLECENIIVARRRGNSAQQMSEFGRNPSRESVVVFRRP